LKKEATTPWSNSRLRRRSDRVFGRESGRLPSERFTGADHEKMKDSLRMLADGVEKQSRLEDHLEAIEQLFVEYEQKVILIQQRVPKLFKDNMRRRGIISIKDLLTPEGFNKGIYAPIYEAMIAGRFGECIDNLSQSLSALANDATLKSSKFSGSILAATLSISFYCLHRMGHPGQAELLEYLVRMQSQDIAEEDRKSLRMALLAYASYEDPHSKSARQARELAGPSGLKARWEPGIAGCELRLALDYGLAKRLAPDEPMRDLERANIRSVVKAHEALGDNVLSGSYWKPKTALVSAYAHHGGLDDVIACAYAIRLEMLKKNIDMPHVEIRLLVDEARVLWEKSSSKKCHLAVMAAEKVMAARRISGRTGIPLVHGARTAYVQSVIDEIQLDEHTHGSNRRVA